MAHERQLDAVRRRLRWRSWTPADLARSLELPGGTVGLGSWLRELVERGEAHEIDGAWHAGPAPTEAEEAAPEEDTVTEAPAPTVGEQIMADLAEHPWSTSRAIAERLDITVTKASRELNAAGDAVQRRKLPGGPGYLYALPDAALAPEVETLSEATVPAERPEIGSGYATEKRLQAELEQAKRDLEHRGTLIGGLQARVRALTQAAAEHHQGDSAELREQLGQTEAELAAAREHIRRLEADLGSERLTRAETQRALIAARVKLQERSDELVEARTERDQATAAAVADRRVIADVREALGSPTCEDGELAAQIGAWVRAKHTTDGLLTQARAALQDARDAEMRARRRAETAAELLEKAREAADECGGLDAHDGSDPHELIERLTTKLNEAEDERDTERRLRLAAEAQLDAIRDGTMLDCDLEHVAERVEQVLLERDELYTAMGPGPGMTHEQAVSYAVELVDLARRQRETLDQTREQRDRAERDRDGWQEECRQLRQMEAEVLEAFGDPTGAFSSAGAAAQVGHLRRRVAELERKLDATQVDGGEHLAMLRDELDRLHGQLAAVMALLRMSERHRRVLDLHHELAESLEEGAGRVLEELSDVAVTLLECALLLGGEPASMDARALAREILRHLREQHAPA